MVKDAERPPLPPGSDAVRAWAKQRRLAFEPYPDDAWFRAWEPYDTMVSAEAYFNSASWPLPGGSATLAEPWYAAPDLDPLDRTVLVFISHPGFRRRAAARGGEHFNTRVAFVENPPPPRVEIGDPTWDAHMATYAASPSEATDAFPKAVRRQLAKWGFTGHLEVRPGGLVVHWAGVRPEPEALDRLHQSTPRLMAAYFE